MEEPKKKKIRGERRNGYFKRFKTTEGVQIHWLIALKKEIGVLNENTRIDRENKPRFSR